MSCSLRTRWSFFNSLLSTLIMVIWIVNLNKVLAFINSSVVLLFLTTFFCTRVTVGSHMLLQCKLRKVSGEDYEIYKDIDDMYSVVGKELNLDPVSPRKHKKLASKRRGPKQKQKASTPKSLAPPRILKIPSQDYNIEVAVSCRSFLFLSSDTCLYVHIC